MHNMGMLVLLLRAYNEIQNTLHKVIVKCILHLSEYVHRTL